MSETDARLTIALETARAAGALAAEHWRGRDALVIETKASRQDMVSEADRAVEALIRETVTRAFPDDGFLGEEYGETPGRSGFDWVIDPIDGTSPFLHGMPNWCVSIAVAHVDRTVIGVIAVPSHGETYHARLGGGAWLDGRRLALDPGLGVGNAATGIGASHRTDPAWIARVTFDLARQGGMFFRNGSGALMLAYVAAGRLAGYLEPDMHAWDCLAGLLLVREAGGRTGPYPEGADRRDGGSVLAAAPGAWDALERLMRG
jgi:myo-inositol-1(or 4)-monophosphatase